MQGWTDYFGAISQGLAAMVVTDGGGRELRLAEGVNQWVAMTRATQQRETELERLKQAHASDLEGLQKQHAAKLAASERAHADELSELREEHAVAAP